MPMFYGQIKMQKYLDDPEVSFSAIGDAIVPENPAIQVTEFGQGKSIDQLIKKLFLVGNGGVSEKESFDLAAYFYTERCKLTNSEFPFFFVTGDEGFYEQVPKQYFKEVFDINIGNEFISGRDIMKKLMTKFNVFHLKKAYISQNKEEIIHKQWIDTIGEERVLKFTDPKACVDIMLGVIALTTGVRTLETYVKDMKIREQTKERIELVKETLKLYSQKLSSGNINLVKATKEIIVDSNLDLTSLSLKIPTNELNEIKEVTEKLLLGFGVSDEKISRIKNMKRLIKEHSNIIPKDLICPITNELFIEPVITSDGITYEEKAIRCWLVNNDTSPLTGQKLENKNLLPNNVISKLVQNFYEGNIDLLK